MGLRALGEASDAAQRIYRSNVASVDAVGDIKAAMLQTRLDVANQTVSQDAATNSGDVARTVSGVAEVATATADGAMPPEPLRSTRR